MTLAIAKLWFNESRSSPFVFSRLWTFENYNQENIVTKINRILVGLATSLLMGSTAFAEMTMIEMGDERVVVCPEVGFSVPFADMLEMNIKRAEPLAKIIDRVTALEAKLVKTGEQLIKEDGSRGELIGEKIASLKGVFEKKESPYEFALEGKNLHESLLQEKEDVIRIAQLHQAIEKSTDSEEIIRLGAEYMFLDKKLQRTQVLLDPCFNTKLLTVFGNALHDYLGRLQELHKEVKEKESRKLSENQTYLEKNFLPHLSTPESWGFRDPVVEDIQDGVIGNHQAPGTN